MYTCTCTCMYVDKSFQTSRDLVYNQWHTQGSNGWGGGGNQWIKDIWTKFCPKYRLWLFYIIIIRVSAWGGGGGGGGGGGSRLRIPLCTLLFVTALFTANWKLWNWDFPDAGKRLCTHHPYKSCSLWSCMECQSNTQSKACQYEASVGEVNTRSIFEIFNSCYF